MKDDAQTTQPYVKKGWCPGALKPMVSGDGYIVRIKPWMASISVNQAQLIGEIAQRYAAPKIELSSKGNLQIRGIQADHLKQVQTQLQQAGLLDATSVLEGRRNIVVHPKLVLDESCDYLESLYGSIVEALNQYPHEKATPAKFSFLIDDADSMLFASMYADVRFEISQHEGELKVRLAFGGDRFSAAHCGIFPIADAQHQAFSLVENFFNARLNDMKIKPWLLQQKEPLRLKQASDGESVQLLQPPIYGQYKEELSDIPCTLLSSAFGEVSLDKWQAIMRLQQLAHAQQMVITPHKALLLAGVAEKTAIKLIQQEALLALQPLSQACDFNFHACSGKPYCSSAHGETKNLLNTLVRECPRLLDGSVHLHVSACAKGCAYAAAADMVVVIEKGAYQLGFGKKAKFVNAEPMTLEQLKNTLKTLNKQYGDDHHYNTASEFLSSRM